MAFNQFAAALPSGVTLSVPSSLTGLLLHYYLPHPLEDLILRLPEASQGCLLIRKLDIGAFSVLPALLATERGGLDSDRIALAYRSALLEPQSISSLDDLLGLASAIVGKPIKSRKQIAFSGGSSPSTAQAIFAPDSEIPGRMQSLASVLAGQIPRSPIETAALVGYYVAHVHPFEDGNGRFSRVASALAGAKAGSPWAGVSVALFLAIFKDPLTYVWYQARIDGLELYFDFARRFCNALQSEMDKVGVSDATRRLQELLQRRESERVAARIAFDIVSKGGTTVPQLRAVLGCSEKKAAGILGMIAEELAGHYHYDLGTLSGSEFSRVAAAAVAEAYESISEEITGGKV